MKASAGSRVLMLLENGPYQFDWRPKAEARTLMRAGYRVSVICPRSMNGIEHYGTDDARVYSFRAPPDAEGFLGYLWEYVYATCAMFLLSLVVLFREGFDILHAHNPPETFFPIAAFYKLLGKPFVFDHHDLSPELYCASSKGRASRVVHRILVLFEKLTCRFANQVIATNESYKAIEIERDRVPAERIKVVRNGPDLARIRPVEPDPVLRQRSNTILGYVGTMGPQDGVDYLLRAIRHLVYDLDRRDVLCVIVGGGKMLPQLKKMVKELGIETHVWFTGRVSDQDLMRYLSTADICVDPDPSNPFNDRCTMIKMMEYMALGKPIVAFALPEHRVTARDAAAYARPNDELDMARQIAALMDDPARRARMGKTGRMRVETELAWLHQEPHLLKAYEALDCSGRPARSRASDCAPLSEK
ncbi:MAG: glycosyltransferase family 4 protein [Chloroflexi bacterium]|nr:glycosyltransferase family 4 protein [Chloroflexota bacterium]